MHQSENVFESDIVGDYMAVSIKDVAKNAGVSVSTVSRALNGYTDVNEKTRKKVQKTVRELVYVPNQSAKNLSSKSKRNMALIISDLYKNERMDEFTGNILRGIYEYVNERGTTVATYGISTKMQKEKLLEDMCSEYSLSGVIIMGMKIQDEYLIEAGRLDIPCVAIDTVLQGKNIATVMTNDEAAFEEIIDYVLDQGHREVVLIKGKEDAEVTHKRYRGFKKAIEKHRIDIDNIGIFDCYFNEAKAFENTKAYIEKYQKTRATAFICMSDLMALGVCRAVSECGYSVPEDFSVTGFDGLYTLDYIKPGITTINQNIREKGYVGIKVLNDMLNGEVVSDRIFVPHKLIVRDSVKRLDI